jgi:peptidoglycan/LPS O-acetylase OafA/YrhL
LVLSSFLILSLLFIEQDQTGEVSLQRFFIRRALRIWPLYYAYLIAILLALPLFGVSHEQHMLILKQQALPFLTFFGNFSYAYFGQSFNNLYSHLWTICLEEQFYLVAPIAVILFNKRMRQHIVPATIVLIGFAMLWRVYMVALVPYPMVWVNPITRIDPFVIGGLCASITYRAPGWMRRPKVGALLLAAGVVGFCLIAASPRLGTTQNTSWQLAVSAGSSGLLILAALIPSTFARALTWGHLPFLGKISFGLYVYHGLAIYLSGRWLAQMGLPSDYWHSFALTFPVCVALASASYLLVERRFLKLKERFEMVKSRPA